MGAVQALLAGLAAGLGVALPLGAISVLLLTEGLARGWRSGLAGAAGVALVDASYATLAVVAGGVVVAALGEHAAALGRFSAAVVLLVAGWGLLSTWRARASAPLAASPVEAGGDRRASSAFLRFVALTALNPLTAAYFLALTVAMGDRMAAAIARAAFVLGVLCASLAWQSLLVGIGVVVGTSVTQRGRTLLGLAGYLCVLGYGVYLVRA